MMNLKNFIPASSSKKELISFLLIIVYAFILAGLATLLIYHPIYLALPIALITPIIIAILHYFKISPPYYNEVFSIIKLYSTAIGVIIVPLLILGVISEKYLPIIIIVILSLNIAEAVVVDLKSSFVEMRKISFSYNAIFSTHVFKHLLNGISGIIVMLTFPLVANIYWVKPYFVYAGSAGIIYWVIAYTVWNWNFVMLNFPRERSLVSVAYLSAPLIFIGYINVIGYWLIARAITLFLGQAIQGFVGYKTFFPFLQALHYFKMADKLETRPGQFFIFLLIAILNYLLIK